MKCKDVEGDHITEWYESLIRVFVVFFTVYPTSLTFIHVRRHPFSLFTILVLESDKLNRQSSPLNVNRFVIVHGLFGLVTVDLEVDCKF